MWVRDGSGSHLGISKQGGQRRVEKDMVFSGQVLTGLHLCDVTRPQM